MLTDYAHHLKGERAAGNRGLLLPHGWSNAVVCLGAMARQQQQGRQLRPALGARCGHSQDRRSPAGLEIDQLVDVMTFLAVEKRIASSLARTGADDRRHDQRRRRASHRHPPADRALGVAHGSRFREAPRQALHAVYDALVAAADFYALRNQHKGGFDYPDAAAMYRAYETELYRFDQLYRHFCEAADSAEAQGWNIVKPLRATSRPITSTGI